MRRVIGIAFALIVLFAIGPGAAAIDSELTSAAEAAAHAEFAEGMRLRHDAPLKSRAAFDRAIAGYEQVGAEFDGANGGVQYNIGNCYLMSGRVGRAIAAYRKAQVLRPGDDNIRANLHVARMRVADRFEQPAGSVVARALLFWRHWGGERQVIAFLIGNALLWLTLAGRMAWVRVPRWPAVVGAVIASAMGISVWVDVSRDAPLAGVVVDGAVVGRQGPGGEGEYEPSFTRALSEGVEFRVVEDRERWLLVEFGDGRQTWLPREQIELFAAR